MANRLECTDGNHSKYWEWGIQGDVLVTHWGRIGTVGTWQTRNMSPSAQIFLERVIEEKLAKGYRPVGQITWTRQQLGSLVMPSSPTSPVPGTADMVPTAPDAPGPRKKRDEPEPERYGRRLRF